MGRVRKFHSRYNVGHYRSCSFPYIPPPVVLGMQKFSTLAEALTHTVLKPHTLNRLVHIRGSECSSSVCVPFVTISTKNERLPHWYRGVRSHPYTVKGRRGRGRIISKHQFLSLESCMYVCGTPTVMVMYIEIKVKSINRLA